MPASRHHRDRFSLSRPLDNVLSAFGFVVFVQAQQRLADLKMLEEFAGVAGIFAGDTVYLAQDSQSAQGDVFEVAQRRGYQIDCARHSLEPPAPSSGRRGLASTSSLCRPTCDAVRRFETENGLCLLIPLYTTVSVLMWSRFCKCLIWREIAFFRRRDSRPRRRSIRSRTRVGCLTPVHATPDYAFVDEKKTRSLRSSSMLWNLWSAPALTKMIPPGTASWSSPLTRILPRQ